MRKAKAVYEYLPIFNRHIFYTNDIPSVKKLINCYLKSADIDSSNITEDRIVHGYVAPILCSKNETWLRGLVMYVRDDSDLGTIAHEATHVVSYIFDYIGQDLDAVNDEAQAYLTGYITQRFMENIRGVKPSKDAPLKKIKK